MSSNLRLQHREDEPHLRRVPLRLLGRLGPRLLLLLEAIGPIRGVLPTRRFLPALTKRSRPDRGRAVHRPRRSGGVRTSIPAAAAPEPQRQGAGCRFRRRLLPARRGLLGPGRHADASLARGKPERCDRDQCLGPGGRKRNIAGKPDPPRLRVGRQHDPGPRYAGWRWQQFRGCHQRARPHRGKRVHLVHASARLRLRRRDDARSRDASGLRSQQRGGDQRRGNSSRLGGLCADGSSHAVLFSKKGGVVDLNTVAPASDGFTYSNAIGINNAGTIVGIAVGPDGFTTRAFLLVRE